VPASTVVASPVLVGRDALLARAAQRIDAAAAGAGGLLLLAGEAGIGKTRLLGSIGRRAEQSAFSVLRAAAFPGDAEASGGLLLDLAGDLERSADEELRAVGRTLATRLTEPDPVEQESTRRRRLLVQHLTDSLAGVDPRRRLLLSLEDLHWADELSLEVIGHLAARLPFRSILVVGAYRSDELYPRTPARLWRNRLTSSRLGEELRLPRLTAEQTAVLSSAVLGRPAPAAVVAALHDRSDGIPLHVEELLAAAGVGTGDGALDVGSLAVPDTLADAVVLRVEALDHRAQEVAAAAAVIGRSFDFDLLTAVLQEDPDVVDRWLGELRQVHLVQAGAEAAEFDFRHALIRDAVYATVSLPRRRQLHERVAAVAVGRGYPDAFVSAHFEQAGLAEEAHRHAVIAARDASSLSAHREALRLYRRALQNLPADAAPGEHAELLAAVGDEAAAVDENRAAAEAYEQAHRLWSADGDRVAAAAVVPRQAAVAHLLGDGLDRRAPLLERALASLEGAPGAERVRARLLDALAAVYMLDRRLDESLRFGEQSRVLSEAVGDERTAIDTAATVGSVLLFAGRMAEGWPLLERTIERATDLRYESGAARGYRMLASCASVLVEYDRAESWLDRGIAYADSVELWNHRNYLVGHRAHVEWATGRWVQAQASAEHALADGRGGITTLITARYVLGYLALGRQEWPAATEHLQEALRRGESMTELQRYSPPLWGLAEAALLQGDGPAAVAFCERGLAASERVADAAYLFPFLLTGLRALLGAERADDAACWAQRVEVALRRRSIPGTLPALVHARGLLALAAGRFDAAHDDLTAAVEQWTRRRRFWEANRARLDLAGCALRLRRPADAAALVGEVRTSAADAGATALGAAADRVLPPARGGRPEPWSPLSAREFDVARLVSAGLTNREIATRLVLSPKTVSAHVEHILGKLGMARRAQIAAWAAAVDAAVDARTESR
jgi:DNA-binding CsgD family transcriptional regulator/tetratricopeptide (TPR) repeat protein